MTTDSSTQERVQETASTAGEEARNVAGVASDEVKSVAAEATERARGVVGDAMTQVQGQADEQARTQKDRLTGTLGTLGDDLHRMADQSEPGLAKDVAKEVADRARSLASHLDGHEPAELVQDLRDFARRRPGTFLLGALAAGVVVGRLARGVRDSAVADDAGLQSGETPGSDVTTAVPRPTPGAPLSSSSPSTPGQRTQPETIFNGGGLAGGDLSGDLSGDLPGDLTGEYVGDAHGGVQP